MTCTVHLINEDSNKPPFPFFKSMTYRRLNWTPALAPVIQNLSLRFFIPNLTMTVPHQVSLCTATDQSCPIRKGVRWDPNSQPHLGVVPTFTFIGSSSIQNFVVPSPPRAANSWHASRTNLFLNSVFLQITTAWLSYSLATKLATHPQVYLAKLA